MTIIARNGSASAERVEGVPGGVDPKPAYGAPRLTVIGAAHELTRKGFEDNDGPGGSKTSHDD